MKELQGADASNNNPSSTCGIGTNDYQHVFATYMKHAHVIILATGAASLQGDIPVTQIHTLIAHKMISLNNFTQVKFIAIVQAD